MTLKERLNEATDNKELDIRTVRVRIVGDSSLITHRYPPAETYKNAFHGDPVWPLKTAGRNPVKEFADAIYWLTDEKKYPGLNRAVKEAQNAETMDAFLLACANGARFGGRNQIFFIVFFDVFYQNGRTFGAAWKVCGGVLTQHGRW